MDRKKVLELDKICRVCISERKEMRPLFNEKVAEMLMECTSVTIEPTEGWPDKICVQCVHSVSRCHAFKALVERSDKELREYVKSLTVRVVIENPQEQKMQQLQQKQAKLLQLQQQQQVLLAQHQEHQKLQLEQEERQQQKQQKMLQKQLQQKQRQLQEGKQQLLQQQQHHEQKQKQQQQKQNMQLQQQQNLHHKKKTSPRKTSRPTKKQQTLHQQHPQPVAIHSVSKASTQIVATISRQQQQHASQLLPATAALPQQIVLPNGQVITTAQIVTHSGPPQIAQIYNNNSTPTTSSLQQLAPHIIQSANGQTLQLIQQSNGQQTLQLVQLVQQQQPRKASIVEINDINEQQATSRLDHHLVDHDDLDEDQLDCNAIVIKEEELHTQPLLATVEEEYDEQLSQGETQEFEYLEDITVTTTAHQQLGDGLDDDEISQHHQHLLHVSGEDEDIIEEIHMEEELLEDVEEDDVDVHHEMHVMNAEEDVEFDHNLMDEELQYTVIEYSDEIAEEVEQEANPASAQPQINLSISEGSNTPTCSISNVSSTYKKTSARKCTKSSVPASRTLPATASTIATAGTNEDFQMDQKFIAEFISQQTTSLGAGRYVCNLCRQEFKHFKGLQNHMHSHSNWIRANCKKQPQCDICLKSFKGPGMLKMHMKTHQSGAKTPVCNICQKVFKSKAILYRHRQTHQLRSYSCGIEMCRKTFSTHPNLRMHMTKKHPNEAQPKYKCGECASLFDDVDGLHAHVNSHGRGEEENVTISGEILAESDLLTLHSGHQVKLDGMVTMSDVIVVT